MFLSLQVTSVKIMDKTDFCNVSLIILDVDGVFTDGKKVYSLSGDVVYKTFYDKDFTVLNMLRDYFDIVILSGDDRINKQIFESKKIPFYHSNKKGKKKLIRIIMNKYNVGPDNCIFIGDDYPDIHCFHQIPLSFCPSDAVADVKNLAYKVLPVKGGCGVIGCLYKELVTEIMLRKKYGVI